MSGFHFVIADDDAIARLAIATFLTSAYPECLLTEAADGADALNTCIATSITLLITNQHMLSLSGMDLIRALRARGMTTPILMVTGDAGVVTAALAAGADAVLEKPYSIAQLGAAVAALLDVR